ncbi:unnamed protein product [Lathyrus sativus]|nr:unnamed protein product [Lathyrus sativus]
MDIVIALQLMLRNSYRSLARCLHEEATKDIDTVKNRGAIKHSNNKLFSFNMTPRKYHRKAYMEEAALNKDIGE